jgi:hypothetical protein
VKLADIVSLTFRFHQAIYISLTQKCPIRCRHCFVESEPTRNEHIEPEEFRRWMDGIAAQPDIKVVFFSGGEPLSNPRALRYGLEVCAREKLYSILGTSAFWAKSPEQAAKLLDSYPPFNCLWISTDLFHEEFVPLPHLRYAAEAAVERGLDVAFQIVDDDPEHSEFMRRFEREVGYDLAGPDQIYITPLGRVGRATTEVEPPLVQIKRGGVAPDLSAIEDVPCPWLGTPWLHEDGVVTACPNLDVHKKAAHPLQLGRLHDATFEALSARADRDSYLQALRVLGPRGLAENFPVEEWGWDRAAFKGTTACELCHSLASTPELPARLREAAVAEELSGRIAALRLMLYAEAPAPAPEPRGAGAL